MPNIISQYVLLLILFSPDINDFESFEVNVTFFPDEGRLQSEYCLPTLLPITDDDINEAEQMFVVQIDLVPVQVQSPDSIISSRNTSLCTIVDNDREYI